MVFLYGLHFHTPEERHSEDQVGETKVQFGTPEQEANQKFRESKFNQNIGYRKQDSFSGKLAMLIWVIIMQIGMLSASTGVPMRQLIPEICIGLTCHL